MRRIDEIIIHCSATRPSMDIGVEEITQWHTARGFSSCGYHFVIRRSGDVETGRAIEYRGAHARGRNANSIGIALVGGIGEENFTPDANYTEDQWESLEDLVLQLMEKYDVEHESVIGHNSISSKACPCFNVKKWVSTIVSKKVAPCRGHANTCPHCGKAIDE